VTPGKPVIAVLAEAVAAGGRHVARPLCTVLEELLSVVRLKGLAEDIGDVNVGLKILSHAEASEAAARARIVVSQAADAANRVADDQRQRAAMARKLEAEARLLEAQADTAEAAALEARARAQLDGARASQVRFATDRLEQAIRRLNSGGGELAIDASGVDALLRQLRSPNEPSDDLSSGEEDANTSGDLPQ
jgi:hypothetical protein